MHKYQKKALDYCHYSLSASAYIFISPPRGHLDALNSPGNKRNLVSAQRRPPVEEELQ